VTFTERGGWWVVGQMALLGLFGLGLLGTDPVTEGVALGFAQGSGLALMAVAIVIGAWSLGLIRRSLSLFPAPTSDALLVRKGPFRLVRHPIYLAVVLGTIGVALVALNPSALVVALVFVPFFMAKSGHEEDLLMERFFEYREYRSTVPYRLIPWVL
jgi:protein-S-isoprenylcysteine O-methyltransferase Ste14